MNLPMWAPEDLVKRYNELVPKAEKERKRMEEFKANPLPHVDTKALELGDLYYGLTTLVTRRSFTS